MTLVLGSAELRTLARHTYTWVDNLSTQIGRVGRSRDWAAEADGVMARISRDAAGFSWGTSDETSRAVPHLITTINDVAIHAGTVDAVTGAAKSPNLHESLAAAKRAHGAVQSAMMARGWHPNGNEFYWPR